MVAGRARHLDLARRAGTRPPGRRRQPGDYLVGAWRNSPLSDAAGVYAMVTYMHQSAARRPVRGSAKTPGISRSAWRSSGAQCPFDDRGRPLLDAALPVANNGYFLVDTNRVF